MDRDIWFDIELNDLLLRARFVERTPIEKIILSMESALEDLRYSLEMQEKSPKP